MVTVDVATAVLLSTLHLVGFLLWAVVGNVIAGKQADLFHPLAAKAKPFHRISARTEQLLSVYLLAYVVLVIASLSQWGRLRRWVRSMLAPSRRAPTPGVSPVVSTSSTRLDATSPSANPSTTSLSPKSSRKRLGGRSKSQRRPSRRSLTPPEHRVDVPSVMRSSVVASHNQVIPPLPRLSMSEETEDKISRLMKKFDSIDAVKPLDQDSDESVIKDRKKA